MSAPTSTSKWDSRAFRIFPWVFVCSGTLSLSLGLWLGTNTYQLLKRAKDTFGVIVELVPHSGSKGGTIYSAKFSFVDDAENKHVIESRFSSSSPPYKVGDQVKVKYDPLDPENAQINRFFELWFGTLIASLIGIGHLGAAIGVLLYVQYRRRKQVRLAVLPSG